MPVADKAIVTHVKVSSDDFFVCLWFSMRDPDLGCLTHISKDCDKCPMWLKSIYTCVYPVSLHVSA